MESKENTQDGDTKSFQIYSKAVPRLPSLELDSENEEDDMDGLEPIVFHPKLPKDEQTSMKNQISKTTCKDSGINITVEQKDSIKPLVAKGGHLIHQVSKNVQTMLSKRNLDAGEMELAQDISSMKKLDAAEIELDNALIQCPKSEQSIQVENLNDSGSSGSSLLGKLESALVKLQESNENRKEKIDSELQKVDGESVIKTIADIKEQTVKIDLRSIDVQKNNCVMERYGSSSSFEDGDDKGHSLDAVRQRLKEESARIVEFNNFEENIKNETVIEADQNLQDFSKVEKNHDNQFGENYNNCKRQNSEEKMRCELSSSVMVKCVDSMLDNVNRIMYQISDPGQNDGLVNELGEVTDLCHCINDEDEFESEDEEVQMYTVYDETTGDETYISPNLCVRRLESNTANSFEESDAFSEIDYIAMSDIDTESNVKLIDWSEVLQSEQTDTYARSASPVETQVEENVFDSLFKNSFLSVPRNNETKIDEENCKAKKKTDILGLKKKNCADGNSIANATLTQPSLKHSEFVSVRSGSMNKNYVADVKTKKSTRVTTKLNVNEQMEENNLLESVKEFKREIHHCMKEESIERKVARQLNFQSGSSKMDKDQLCQRENDSCVTCNAKVIENMETPSKDFLCTCQHEIAGRMMKTTRSAGVSTNDLFNQNVTKGTVSSENANNFVEKDKGVPSQPKSSKNRKKKKNKTNKGTDQNATEPIVNDVSANIYLSSDEKREMKNVVDELSNLHDGKVLYDENVSFTDPYPVLPNTNKQLLVLKVPLESPGVCKANTMTSVIDQSNSDNFIGLTSFFLLLLQGSKWGIPAILPDIPFDVVSIQQTFLNGELFLIVGIAENQNTYQQKKKRTKLGTSFFHAVSQYLNSNYLENVLSKIWDITELEHIKQNGFMSRNIWKQEDLRRNEKCTVPGSGKLSSYINITPDTQALQKILSVTPSFFVHNEHKFTKTVPDELNQFQGSNTKQDYTCITVHNILSIYPKHISELLKRLRSESVELCGLKLGYVKSDCGADHPTLCIGIKETRSTTIEEGKLLLSDCEELKNVAISFNTSNKISLVENTSTLLNYVINKTYSQQELTRWFGPHYRPTQVSDVIDSLKSSLKVINNKSQKKKWSDASSQLSQLVHFPSYAVLLMSSIVPSAFISLVISFATKKGLVLTAISKNSFPSGQLRSLGLNEEQVLYFGYSNDTSKNLSMNFPMMGSFSVFLFHGNSACIRLLGLIEKLTYILNNNLTGETVSGWLNDVTYISSPSHNVNQFSWHCQKLTKPAKHYFAALHYNHATEELFGKSESTAPSNFVENVFPVISAAQLNLHKPEIHLVGLVFYGMDIMNYLPVVLKMLFADLVVDNMKTWRSTHYSITSSIMHTPSLELIGIKYLTSLSTNQSSSLILDDFVSSTSATSAMLGSNATVIILKAVDKRTVTRLQEKLSKYLQSLRIDFNKSNLLVHTDLEYVCRLMFYFFKCSELHSDLSRKKTQVFPICLPQNHKLFTILDKILNLNLLQDSAVKKTLPSKDYKNVPRSLFPLSKTIYQLHPMSITFPLQLLLKGEKSYSILSIQHSAKHTESIIKVISRLARLDFEIIGLKFPSFDNTTSSYWLHVVLMRADALYVLSRMKCELENSYEYIRINATETVQQFEELFEREFRGPSGTGGIFHFGLYSLFMKMCFEKDAAYEGRHFREVEWNPEHHVSTYEYEYMKQERLPLSKSFMVTASRITDEVTVMLITQPLIRGVYLNKKLPAECLFPELWHNLEQASYKTIGAKMTMLSQNAAHEVINMFNASERKKYRMVNLLSDKGGPFIALVLFGSCVLSDFWLRLESKFDNEEAIEAVKEHTLISTTKNQVEVLLCSLFQQVLQNPKVELRSSMV